MIWKHKNNRIQIHIIEALGDNYIYLLEDIFTSKIIAIDPGCFDSTWNYLQQNKLKLSEIWITHHHEDHIAGINQLQKETQAQVKGSSYDKHRLPTLNIELVDQQLIDVFDTQANIIYAPGHTSGHILFYIKKYDLLFTGDVLFLMGCGRVIEGNYLEMFSSLQKIKALPLNTHLFCTHEYTRNNAEFSAHILPDNPNIKRRLDTLKSQKDTITVPGKLETELITNPFLIAKTIEEFTSYRDSRNHW